MQEDASSALIRMQSFSPLIFIALIFIISLIFILTF